jgi:hypothetical protein
MESTRIPSEGTGNFRRPGRNARLISEGGAKTRCRRHERRKTREVLHRYLGHPDGVDE